MTHELLVMIRQLFIFIFISKSLLLAGQTLQVNTDSLRANFSLGFIGSNENEPLPFYLMSNRWGEVDEEQSFFVSGVADYQKSLNENWNFRSEFSFRNKVISSYYLSINYKKILLSVGRKKENIGGLENSLSSGSLGLSGNSLPIPQIKLGFPEYVDVPWTKGFFKIKGHISQGWFENDRYISNALLHSKSFYLMLDLEDEIGWIAASGVVHFAQFGGTSPQGEKQPSSFPDFLRVFAGSGIPNPDGTTAGESNGLGNHLGIIETVVTQKIGTNQLKINYQKPFEDFGGLQYISLTDYLFGIEWTFPKKRSLVSRAYAEYIQTKWQGGPGLPDATETIENEEDNFGYSFGGRDDTYNNFLYRSGWTYKGQVVGNPLFLTHQRTLGFLENYPDYGVAIANNRIRAVHFAMEGWLGTHLNYSGQFTYSQNFGTYAGLYEGRFAWSGIVNDPNFEYVFRPMQEQIYSSIDLSYDDFSQELPIRLNLRLAYDFGDFYEALGTEVSIAFIFNSN